MIVKFDQTTVDCSNVVETYSLDQEVISVIVYITNPKQDKQYYYDLLESKQITIVTYDDQEVTYNIAKETSSSCMINYNDNGVSININLSVDKQ